MTQSNRANKSKYNQAEIDQIRETVVNMYSKIPWPSTREADQEMGWRLRMLGVRKEDFAGKRVLELGCGTGEYALWYAANGAKEVVGVDLSDGSLKLANQKKEQAGLTNITFRKADILNLDPTEFPDEAFDYAYSVGVLHHTGDPEKGFAELCRMTRPGGVVIVSLYNSYSRCILRIKQNICKLLGGDDIDKRARIGQKLFPFFMASMNKRYGKTNREAIAYDVFGFPHESIHTAEEVLEWFDVNKLDYIGAFGPLRIRDYFYAYSLPEYHEFKRTFSGFPLVQAISWVMNRLAGIYRRRFQKEDLRYFPRPTRASTLMTQLIWFIIGNRINCFTMSAIKPKTAGTTASGDMD